MAGPSASTSSGSRGGAMERSSVSSMSRTPTREDAVSSTERSRPESTARLPVEAKRVLILHVRAGAGHERAARAVERAIQQLDPAAQPMVQDALVYSSKLLRT